MAYSHSNSHSDPHKMYVKTDTYLNDKEHFDKMAKEYGMVVCPEDLNRAYVNIDKYEDSNLEETEESIQKRFSL